MGFLFGSRRKLLAVAVGAPAVLALGVGLAVASIPDSSGVIHACYQKNQGQTTLR
jgi:hypothetical protein